MKIGVSSYSFSKYMKDTGCTYLDICNIAKEIGYDGIEFIDLKSEISGCKDDIETARQIREHCAKIGLEIAAYTIGANFLCDDPDAEVERVKHCVDVAVELGAPVMRHDACWGPAVKGHGYTWRDAVETMAPYIRRVTEYAATKGVKTMTENHGHFIQDPERVEALIKAVNNPNYGWLVDMGNFICAQTDNFNLVGEMPDLDIVLDKATGEVHLENVGCIPTIVHYTSPDFGNLAVYPYSKYTPELADSHGVPYAIPQGSSTSFSWDIINDIIETNIPEEFRLLDK